MFQNRPGFDPMQKGSQTLSRQQAMASKNRNRFSKLNKSSSLHDIAHGLAGNGFVSRSLDVYKTNHVSEWTTALFGVGAKNESVKVAFKLETALPLAN